jgi:hypothetical protein
MSQQEDTEITVSGFRALNYYRGKDIEKMTKEELKMALIVMGRLYNRSISEGGKHYGIFKEEK